MANRNIAFTIQLNGQEQVYSSIAELEQAIRTATEELRNFTGTEVEFAKLQDEIKKAGTELNKIKEGTKGLSVNKQIGEFLKLGQITTAAFGAATQALSLFGVENDKVAEAASKAQQILTLQFSLVTLAKEKDTIATAFNTASTIANTLATQGLTAASRILFATIRANPFGAFLTILSLVASAVLLLTNRTKEATTADEDYQKQIERTRNSLNGELRLLESTGASQEKILRFKLNIATQEEAIAQNAYLRAFQQNRFSEETEKLNIERQNKQLDRMIAENNLDTELKAQQIKREEELEDAREEAERKRLERLRKLRTQLGEALQQEITFFQELKVELESFPEPNFFSELQKLLRETESEIERFGGKTFDEILAGFLGQRGELSTRLEEYRQLQILFKEQRKFLSLTAAGVQLTVEKDQIDAFKKLTEQFLDLQSTRLKNNEITKEEFQRSEDLVKVYTNVKEALERWPSLVDLVGQKDASGKDYFGVLRDYLINTKVIVQDINREGELVAATTLVSYSESRDKLEKREQEFQKKIFDSIIATEDYRKILREKGYSEEELQGERLVELVQELARQRVGVLRDLITQEVQFKNDLFAGYSQALKDSVNLEAQSVEGLISIIGNNLDKFIKESEQYFDITSEDFAIFFDNYVQTLLKELTGGRELTDQELTLFFELYRKFGEKITGEIKSRQKDQKTATQIFIDDLKQGIQAFQTGLQAVQQALADYYSFQFDQLEKRNKRVQDTIVGESKRANELRLEQEKAYTAERERLEKRQAKIQLRLTLAQTVANVAQAVAQTLSIPLLAGVVAAAGAAQIAIVTRQIATLDAYNRGGKLRKGQGGLVVGPSHEMGGVKFQGGGVELEGNEAVINRVSTLRYADILSSINVSGGGKPIVMSNFDDSRIVEAIAKQRQTPIRAYVVESDITNAQTINKRLELLSQI